MIQRTTQKIQDRAKDAHDIIYMFGSIRISQLCSFVTPPNHADETTMEDATRLVNVLVTNKRSVVLADDVAYAKPVISKNFLVKYDRGMMDTLSVFIDYLKKEKLGMPYENLNDILVPEGKLTRLQYIKEGKTIVNFLPVEEESDISLLLIEDEEYQARYKNMEKADVNKEYIVITSDKKMLTRISKMDYHLPVIFALVEIADDDSVEKITYLKK